MLASGLLALAFSKKKTKTKELDEKKSKNLGLLKCFRHSFSKVLSYASVFRESTRVMTCVSSSVITDVPPVR